jgi:chromosome segregation ATPase
MIHNSFQLNKKLEKMESEITELKMRNTELIDNVFLKADKFMELTHRINDLSLEIVNLNNKLEKALEKITQQKKSLYNYDVNSNMEDSVLDFIEANNYQHYTENFKYMGIQKLEDFLILNSYELNENGVLFVDAKKIIENAKELVENNETMV